MAETYRFFTSVASDRLYTASQVNEYLFNMLEQQEGVIQALDNELAVTNDGTLSVDIDTGVATKAGALYINSASLHKSLNTVSSGKKRYDRIVIRLDQITNRNFVATIITGVEGTSPAVPDVVAATDVLLAKILIDRSSGTYVYTVTDEREYRPYVYTSDTAIASAINLATGKTVPADADEIGITDSAASYALKKLTIVNWAANLWTRLGALINSGTTKATPIDADAMILMDSAASNATKKLTWANLVATIKTALGYVAQTVGFKISGGTSSKTLTVSADADTANITTAAGKAAADGATATPTAGKVPIADANGQLVSWIPDATTSVKGKSLLGALSGAIKQVNMPDEETPIYAQDAWVTLDGWSSSIAEGTLSTIDGALRYVRGATNNVYIRKNLTSPGMSGKTIIFKFRASKRCNLTFGGYSATSPLITVVATTQWNVAAVLCPVLLTGNNQVAPSFWLGSDTTTNDWFEIDWIWIGNYSYLTGSLSEEATRIADQLGDTNGIGVAAGGTITNNGTAPNDGETVTISGKVYTYKTTLGTTEGQVLIGASAAEAAQNLVYAINYTGTPGTNYYCAAAHPLVLAVLTSSTVVTLSARSTGELGNSITIATTSATLTLSGSTLSGGYSDVAAKIITATQNNIAASGTRPAAAMIEYTNTALAGYENTVDVAAGATFTLPANGTFIWAVNGYGATINSLKKGTSAGGTTLTVNGANSSVWYRRSLA